MPAKSAFLPKTGCGVTMKAESFLGKDEGIVTGDILLPGWFSVGNWRRRMPVPLRKKLFEGTNSEQTFRRQARDTTPSSSKCTHMASAVHSSSCVTLTCDQAFFFLRRDEKDRKLVWPWHRK